MNDYTILEGEFGKEITLSSIHNAEKLIINSAGGALSDGWAIHEFVKSDNKEIGVLGLCASAGTIALLGTENRWGSKHSEFLIHYPWGEVIGDAKKMQETANDLKSAQDELVNLYINNLLIEEKEIRELMENETIISAEKALQIGLIKEIREDTLQPIQGKNFKEKFYNLKKQKMENENVSKEQLNQELEGFFARVVDTIKNILPSKIKNILVKDVEGQEIEFDVDTMEEIVVGVGATINGTPASGSYILEDGSTYIIENGTVTEIVMAEPDEMEALKTENEALKTELEGLKNDLSAKDESIQNLQNDFAKLNDEVGEFKNVFSKKVNNSIDPSVKKENNKKIRTAFKAKN